MSVINEWHNTKKLVILLIIFSVLQPECLIHDFLSAYLVMTMALYTVCMAVCLFYMVFSLVFMQLLIIELSAVWLLDMLRNRAVHIILYMFIAHIFTFKYLCCVCLLWLFIGACVSSLILFLHWNWAVLKQFPPKLL